MIRIIFCIAMAMLWGQFAVAQLCTQWSQTELLGELNVSALPEASGVSSSSLFADRLYHINDSERPFSLHLTNLQGQSIAQIPADFEVRDAEDVDLGVCPQGRCLFVADIGDNETKWPNLNIHLIPEQETYQQGMRSQQLSFIYPDGAHDAESFAVHPNGDIYILTKESINLLRTSAASLYRLAYSEWSQMKNTLYTLEFVLDLDLVALSGFSIDVFSHTATAMDFSDDGSRLFVLTYGDAFEFVFEDLIQGAITYQRIPISRSLQQEGMTYLIDNSILYTAEAPTGSSPIKRLRCLTN